MSSPLSSVGFPLPLVLPPSIQGQLDAATNLLIIGCVFPAFLVPIVIALFLFSNALLRRKPIFILNVLAVLLGLGYGALGIYNMSLTVSAREVPSDVTTALTCLYFFIPICVQCILLVRIYAVYPPQMLTWPKRVLIYGTFGALTIARLINVSLAFNAIEDSARKFPNAWTTAQTAWDIPYSKIEWFLQLFYDILASTLFLMRLREGGALRRRKDMNNSIITDGQRWSYTSRLRALFWIALSNFVLPVIFNVAQLVLIFRDQDFVHGAYVLMVNIYVEIISVLLATLWSSGTHWQSAPASGAGVLTVADGRGRGEGGEMEKPVSLEVGAEAGMLQSLASARFALPSGLGSHTYSERNTGDMQV